MRQYLLPLSDGGTTGERERESAEKGNGKERQTENLWKFEREGRKRQKIGRKGLRTKEPLGCGKNAEEVERRKRGTKEGGVRKSGSGLIFSRGGSAVITAPAVAAAVQSDREAVNKPSRPPTQHSHRLNMELDLQTFFGLLRTAVLIG
jgi:hypothetical protein